VKEEIREKGKTAVEKDKAEEVRRKNKQGG
jgi:hypothetical protein